MKYLVLLLGLFLTLPVWALKDQRQLFKCLGAEEKKFHLKKDTGPLYDLNQKLIGEMIQIPKAELSNEDYNIVCNKPKGSPSWRLLERSIRKGKQMFTIPENVTGMQRAMTIGMIEDYMVATREILLGFISQVQTTSPSPNCLKEEIPELDAFFTDIKYLQEDMPLKKIFEGRDITIFEKLEEWPAAFQRCRERLKKKAKSSSTEGPKKP